jgi:glycosyltransferase involved in cell wall biosynthesis
LRFLLVTTFYPPYSFGGDAMYIYRLAHALGDAGHHVDVVHCIDSYHLLHPAPPPIPFASHPNVEVHGLRSGFGALSPLLTQQTGQPFLKKHRISEIVRQRPFDVVHYHNISLLGPGILGLETPGATPIKLYTTHEHWLVCPMHVLWKFNSRACEKPECLKCTLMARRPPQLWRHTGMLERASRHVDRFVSPSRFTASMHAERGFARPVGHLPYFIDRVDRDWQEPRPRPQDRPYFLFVGRLEVLKGLQTLIPLWDQVQDFDLLVAGTGNDEARLRTQAASNPRIKFLGPLPQTELGPLYVHAVACLVPSVTYETFGIILIESFRNATPVIARRIGPFPEIVDRGGGVLFSTGDELSAAIARLHDDRPYRTHLSRQARTAFETYWRDDVVVASYLDLLRRTAVAKGASRVVSALERMQ